MSVVLSTFMAGLAIGSWCMGKASHRLRSAQSYLGLEIYALLEVDIVISAFVVSMRFKYGEKILLQTGQIDSLAYFIVSALILVMVIFVFAYLLSYLTPKQFTDRLTPEVMCDLLE